MISNHCLAQDLGKVNKVVALLIVLGWVYANTFTPGYCPITLYGVGNTLFLRVSPGGSKQWIQRLTVQGRHRDIGLGGCMWVTLAEARKAAHKNRRIAHRGGDPLAGIRQAYLQGTPS